MNTLDIVHLKKFLASVDENPTVIELFLEYKLLHISKSQGFNEVMIDLNISDVNLINYVRMTSINDRGVGYVKFSNGKYSVQVVVGCTSYRQVGATAMGYSLLFCLESEELELGLISTHLKNNELEL
ncbi:hypothetical protein [Vibrio crassostreae]|uniref:hypothetical protein n=1 Tax=Vibrio crassostreae TaxID=246167 RepID=UPI001B30180F|nr:hypothetical protein [Vibrio crassostreae]CAK2029006.1 hypothetical protein VCRA2114E5_30043 [Vibrio crassostreae]CAK2947713.1 hypothetical protein VCRA2110O2_60042 [Vibrio crassostreae]CAK2995273.1 hypothetical protein VCRA2122O10_60043 [Vibrio crassostreae]CAK3618376.1 hypothetical protein VCRA2126E14_50041 [Vibrio crassostreae]